MARLHKTQLARQLIEYIAQGYHAKTKIQLKILDARIGHEFLPGYATDGAAGQTCACIDEQLQIEPRPA